MQNLETPPQTSFKHGQEDKSAKQAMIALSIVGVVLISGVMFAAGIVVGKGTLHFSGNPTFNTTITSLSAKPNYTELDDLYTTIRQNYDGDLSNQQVMDGLKHGLAASTGDPYTEFMTSKEADEFNGALQGTISGIGAKLEMDDQKNVVIAAPLAGSPAEAAGLRAKDVIIAIDGKAAFGLTTTEAVKKIRGDKGTQVKLTILRNKTEQLNFTITRDTIHIPSVVTKDLANGTVGYIQVSQFSDDTDELARKAAQDFIDKGVKKIVLDLRDNPGGEVTSAVNLTSLWLDKGAVVVQQKRGKTTVSTDYATGDNILKGIPTVVLINAGSASASEITALALRDAGAATIIGETSYGKGVVQQLFPFNDGSSVKITVAKWYSPKGTNIDKKGIIPDKEVKMTEENYTNGTDPQLDTAIQQLQ